MNNRIEKIDAAITRLQALRDTDEDYVCFIVVIGEESSEYQETGQGNQNTMAQAISQIIDENPLATGVAIGAVINDLKERS